jgi:RNA polymerase sigma factor (sigma-70 family)
LVGFVLVWLLLKGAVYALPCIVAWYAARFAFGTGAGWIGSGVIWVVTALAVFFLLRWLYAISRDPIERVAVACAYVGPAVVMAYYEVRRQDRTRVASVSDEELEQILAIQPSPYERADLSPEEMLIAGERFAHMTAVVLALPKRERLALIWHKSAGLTHQEIAERLGVSPHSVPRYLARALAKCANAMAAFEEGASRQP